ncbi:MAG: hypothetical protein WBA67_11790 [Jannaschia sp.]
MSLVTAIAPIGGGNGIGGGLGNAAPLVQTRPLSAQSGSQPILAGSHGTAPGEMTAMAMRVPPVTDGRAANGTSPARPGAEGLAALDLSRAEKQARTEAQARRDAEAAERKLLQKEVMSRIPVPIDAIPKLTGDVEQVRRIAANQEVSAPNDAA